MVSSQRQAAVRGGQPPRAPDPDDATFSAKTRYTLLVTESAGTFTAAFTAACASKFKPQIAAAVHPDAIRSALAAVDLDAVLCADGAAQVFQTAYGYRCWLLAPEEGVRGLLRACLALYEHPLRRIVDAMAATTAAAAKYAMKRAAKGARAGGGAAGSGGAAVQTVQQLLLDQVLEEVSGWREQTWDQLTRNLQAEAHFPAPERFQKLRERLQGLLAAAAAQQAARHTEAYRAMLLDALHRLDQPGKAPYASRKSQAALLAATTAAAPEPLPAYNEYFMGWLEKRNRHGLWQRRWFALSGWQRRLWYFGAPEEQPARGVADLTAARIVEVQGSGDGDDEHTTFRILLADEGGPGAGGAADEGLSGQGTKALGVSLTLRAANAASKRQWCEMLARTIAGEFPPPPPEHQDAQDPAAAKVQQLQAAAAPGAPFSEDSDPGRSPVGRKISTRVFKEEEAWRKDSVASSASDSTAASTFGDSSSGEDAVAAAPEVPLTEEELAEADRRAAEAALFAEIEAQAARHAPTAEERAVLDCVTVAVREYVVETLAYLTEQCSRIIADGMLPGGRAGELHTALLRVLIPAGGGGAGAGLEHLMRQLSV